MSVEAETLTVSFQTGDVSRRFEFAGGEPRIGRGLDCDVVIADSSISRYHASLTKVGPAWVLKDLESSNGTFVGDKRVTLHRITRHENVRLGVVTVSFKVGASSPFVRKGETSRKTHAVNPQTFDGLVHSVLSTARDGAFDQSLSETGSAELLQDPKVLADPMRNAAWIIKILRDASNSLLMHDTLNPILERVVDLVFEHLPATRSSILLYDQKTDVLTPRVERALGAEPGRVRISRHIAEAAVKSRQSILVKDTADDERFACVQSIAEMQIYSAVCAPLYHNDKVSGLIYADRTSGEETFNRTHLEVLSILASLSAAAVDRARLRETLEQERQIRVRLSRYHSPAVVEHILRLDTLVGRKMLAEERVVSVMFCDVVGFTRMSENLSARGVATLLNEVFEILTRVVFHEGGTLDKFIGDNLMAFFGAPLEQADHAARAVRAGLEVQCALRDFNASRNGLPPIEMRVGINSGPVVVGDIGATQRKDYTVIGDTVNVANRLESSVSAAGQVVIGPATYALVADEFECEPLGMFVPRGREQEIRPYLVLPGSPCPDE